MLLDTSGLLPLIKLDDPDHHEAKSHFLRPGRKLITDFVLAELVALAHARRQSRSQVLAFVHQLRHHASITVLLNEPVRFRQALDLLDQRPDKTYSLCDAVSFIVMREFRVTDALTTDRHFSQEGFRCLLDDDADH